MADETYLSEITSFNQIFIQIVIKLRFIEKNDFE